MKMKKKKIKIEQYKIKKLNFIKKKIFFSCIDKNVRDNNKKLL